MHTTSAHRNLLSSLWAFVAFNIAFADILGLYTPGVIPAIIEGVIEGVTLTENKMLIAAVFLQIPVAMIVAAQVLPPRVWRAAHSGAALVTAVFVVGGGSLKPHYVLFASCEILALIAITVLTWRYSASNHAEVSP